MGVNGHCNIHKSLPLDCTLCQVHPVHTLFPQHPYSLPSQQPVIVTYLEPEELSASHCIPVTHIVILSTSLQSDLSRASQLRFYISFDRLIPSHSCHWWCVQVRTAEWIRLVAVFICRRADPSLSSSKNCVFKSMWVMSCWNVLAVSKLRVCSVHTYLWWIMVLK